MVIRTFRSLKIGTISAKTSNCAMSSSVSVAGRGSPVSFAVSFAACSGLRTRQRDRLISCPGKGVFSSLGFCQNGKNTRWASPCSVTVPRGTPGAAVHHHRMFCRVVPENVSAVSGLPHWETIPADIPEAIKEIKAALRKRITDNGRTVEEVVDEIKACLVAEIEDIKATKARGEEVWPVIDFADIESGTVSEASIAKLQRRGCVVIRGHFDRVQAENWDADAVDYVDSNQFFQKYSGPADDFFGTLEVSKPEIYPIYWSSTQMQARQHARMATAQTFLNSQWKSESQGRVWFDPNRYSLYPDRMRRRPPGASSNGLGTHLDPGCLDLWMTEGYQQHFQHLFRGEFAAYDPWDASFRTEAAQFPGSTMCSAFRTFQGWTALSEMRTDMGVLHTIPIPRAMAYLMLRPLLPDVAEDDMCGVSINRAFPVTPRWHGFLLEALSAIPSVAPGDSVWWHCDMVHSVAPVHNQQGWGNVMYIPAAPWCKKNADYAHSVYQAFLLGHSPPDFPAEHYEADWPNRPQRGWSTQLGTSSLKTNAELHRLPQCTVGTSCLQTFKLLPHKNRVSSLNCNVLDMAPMDLQIDRGIPTPVLYW